MELIIKIKVILYLFKNVHFSGKLLNDIKGTSQQDFNILGRQVKNGNI